MTIEFTPEEVGLLHDLVERRVEELGPEIHHTWSSEYKQELRQLRDALQHLLERLPERVTT